MEDLIYLKNSYEKKRPEIRKRLESFKKIWEGSDENIFAELCFCLLTPMSRARAADEAINRLLEKKFLLTGNKNQIIREVTDVGVRFPENKGNFIVEARGFFTRNGAIDIKSKLNQGTSTAKREWLVKNIKGLGYKEASHFLRNIGFGSNLAILDRHIMKNLLKYGVIKEIPKCLTKKCYLSVENKMKEFSKKVGIPLAELDLLFWSEETGEIFK
jgi:N-glycosylase/DNA lyase